jgi:DNA-binding MarR family transcriptional regulator
MNMETEGLIRRIKETPRSTLLKIEVTQKGFNLIRSGRESKIMAGVFSSISEKESKQLKSILNKILIQAQNYASAVK